MLQPVRVLAVAAVGRPPRRLHVGGAPRLGAERAQRGRRMERAGADLDVIGLQNRRSPAPPNIAAEPGSGLESSDARGSTGSVQTVGRAGRTIASCRNPVKQLRRPGSPPRASCVKAWRGVPRCAARRSGSLRADRRTPRSAGIRAARPSPAAGVGVLARGAGRALPDRRSALVRQTAEQREALPDRHDDQDRDQNLAERQTEHAAPLPILPSSALSALYQHRC